MTAEEIPVEPAPWWRRRRWWAVAAGALTVAVAATAVAVAANATEPEEVVEDYLARLLQRDAEGALAYTDQLAAFDSVPHDFLVPEAMAADWTVTRVLRRHGEDDDPATVDVTLTAADGTSREGRFNLVENADGDWRILNPLVELTAEQLPADFIELNGVSSTADVFWLFPGAYRAYPSLAGTVTAPTYVAVPPSGDGREDPDGSGIATEAYLPLFGVGPEQAASLQRSFAAWIDSCAASTAPNPAGCPFAAAYGASILLSDGEYTTDEVTWKVETYPVVRLRQGPQSFSLVIVEPGMMRISGEGTPYYPEDAPDEKFSARCGITLNVVSVRLAPEGFTFTASAPGPNCYDPYS